MLRGTVTRVGPSFGGSGTSAGESKPYVSRYADGRTVPQGPFTSVREAQLPIEQAAGGRFLKWTQEERIDGIESYIAEDP